MDGKKKNEDGRLLEDCSLLVVLFGQLVMCP